MRSACAAPTPVSHGRPAPSVAHNIEEMWCPHVPHERCFRNALCMCRAGSCQLTAPAVPHSQQADLQCAVSAHEGTPLREIWPCSMLIKELQSALPLPSDHSMPAKLTV